MRNPKTHERNNARKTELTEAKHNTLANVKTRITHRDKHNKTESRQSSFTHEENNNTTKENTKNNRKNYTTLTNK